MTDTPPEVERRYRAMLLRRSGEERLRMGASMHATAQTLVRASVLARNPAASPADVRRALFLRFYGSDFDPQARQRILVRLAGVARRPSSPGLPAPPPGPALTG